MTITGTAEYKVCAVEVKRAEALVEAYSDCQK
jgi:hypothetical protein